jgi:hypothetical protein
LGCTTAKPEIFVPFLFPCRLLDFSLDTLTCFIRVQSRIGRVFGTKTSIRRRQNGLPPTANMPTRGWTPTDTPTDTQASETINQLSDELFNDNTADNSQGTSMASTTGVTEIARDEKIQGAKRKRVDVPRKRNPSFPPPKKLNQEQWDQMFDRLLEYKDHHGVSRSSCQLRNCVDSHHALRLSLGLVY